MKVGSMMRRLRRLCSEERGNVMVMFSFAMVPVIGLTGATIDYSRATDARQMLNAAVDSAALMAARDATKLSDSELRERINKWIASNLSGEAAKSFTSAAITIDRTARTISVAANLSIDTSLTRLIGHDHMQVASTSQSTWGTNTIELALALDNTGSMASSGKMDALKAASLDLIKIMKDATLTTDQIRISVVPFATQIKVSTDLKDESWLRYDQSKTTWSRDRWGNWIPNTVSITKSTWTGCISDRDQPNDVKDNETVSAYATLYPADFCAYSTLAPITPLTSDWTALTNAINGMTPVGNTNVTIGANWGMATLTPGVPFTGAKPFNTPRLQKYMILLTDGENTQNRFTTSGSAIDERTKLACQSAKDAGIRIYTVRVINGDRTLLQNCATTPSMYYEVSSASQLTPVFQQIAREISQIRLTQ
ncbi:MAG TPA: pilus assembly protein [Bosea sp. (in: a-proteobacteria)]|uniref:vWA domain-containing protein n=1 Tax=Bosea sp. (in: a-proteobacteria) TaxID=1871050 RepID=UPI002DDD645E|nr:pilus assembly protein [Bosea sp. (in: a-proteobacteria)]HEV2552503.1 pilus assembly protein [Bosea sp. (in: a-proteobacteria)]